MVSHRKPNKFIVFTLIAALLFLPAMGTAKSQKRKLKLPAPFHARELKIGGKTYLAHEAYDRLGRVRYSVLTGPNYYHKLVDRNLDGTADVWEVKKGNKQFVARNPYRGRFMLLEFSELMPKMKESSLFVYHEKTDSYILARTKDEPYRQLNMDDRAASSTPPTPQNNDPNCPQPPAAVQLVEDVNLTLQFAEEEVDRQLQCMLEIFKPMLFDKSCLDTDFKESVDSMAKGLALIMASSPTKLQGLGGNIETSGNTEIGGQSRADFQLEADNAPTGEQRNYLGCISSKLRMPEETASIETLLNNHFAVVKDSLAGLNNELDPNDVPADGDICKIKNLLSEKLKRKFRNSTSKRLIKCENTGTGLAAWESEKINDGPTIGQIIIRKKAAETGRALNMEADRAYASVMLHELIHGAGVTDEHFCQSIEKCCSPNDNGDSDTKACEDANTENIRLKDYMLIVQMQLSGQFVSDPNDVFNSLNVDLRSGNHAAELMDVWTNEFGKHTQDDLRKARELPECRTDQSSQACKQAQAYFLQAHWREHTKDFFGESKRCQGLMTGWGKPTSLCEKFRPQFEAMLTLRDPSNFEAVSTFVAQGGQIDRVLKDLPFDRSLISSLGPVTAGSLRNFQPLYGGGVLNGADQNYQQNGSQPALTNPTITIPGQGARPERAVSATTLNTINSGPIRMTSLSQMPAARVGTYASRDSNSMLNALSSAADSARSVILPRANAATRASDYGLPAKTFRSSSPSPKLSVVPNTVSFPASSLNLGSTTVVSPQSGSIGGTSSKIVAPEITSARSDVANNGRNPTQQTGEGAVSGTSSRGVGGITAQSTSRASSQTREPQGGVRITDIAHAENLLLGNYFSALRYLSMTSIKTSLVDFGLRVEDKQTRVYGCRKGCKRTYKYCPKTEKLEREGGC